MHHAIFKPLQEVPKEEPDFWSIKNIFCWRGVEAEKRCMYLSENFFSEKLLSQFWQEKNSYLHEIEFNIPQSFPLGFLFHQ